MKWRRISWEFHVTSVLMPQMMIISQNGPRLFGSAWSCLSQRYYNMDQTVLFIYLYSIFIYLYISLCLVARWLAQVFEFQLSHVCFSPLTNPVFFPLLKSHVLSSCLSGALNTPALKRGPHRIAVGCRFHVFNPQIYKNTRVPARMGIFASHTCWLFYSTSEFLFHHLKWGARLRDRTFRRFKGDVSD